jgi:Xaa-Pro aminopeptidase
MERIDQLREVLTRKKIGGVFISNPTNRNYLSGFTGSTAVLFVTQKSAIFLTDARYLEQAKREVRGFELREVKTAADYYKIISNAVRQSEVKVVGVEAKTMLLSQYESIKKHLPAVKIVREKGLVEELREIKTEEECERIRTAVKVAERAFDKTLPGIKPGISEMEVAALLEYNMRVLGAEGNAFPTIVASGKRGSMPHGVASEKKLQKGELIVIDFGAIYKGYCSDLTRTIGLGIISRLNRDCYRVVYEAQQKAISSIKSGVSLSVPDKKARNYLKKNKMDKYFSHGLGHGIGMDIHENPSISNKTKGYFKTGMVITVEPGVYYTGNFGIRIENDVIVKKNGCEILGADQRKLLVL